jgi:hypothetical protein
MIFFHHCSRQSIKKYVLANNKIAFASQAAFDSQFNKAIKAGVEKGEFTQPKGKSLLPRMFFFCGIIALTRLKFQVLPVL